MTLATVLALLLLFAIWRAIARANRTLVFIATALAAEVDVEQAEHDAYGNGATTSTHPCGQARER